MQSFPFAVIDFEASSLDERSYPIEVGVAIATDPSSPIAVWSTLITPTGEWLEFGKWDVRSERVHGITKEALTNGKAPSEVAAHLNAVCQSQDVWCDGGDYDAHWLKKLFGAAGSTPTFRLNDVSALAALDDGFAIRLKQALAATRPPHRAGQDAERLCAALVSADGRGERRGGVHT